MFDTARTPAPLARSRRVLLGSCAAAALVMWTGVARSQAFTGTVIATQGVNIDRSTPNVDRISINGYGGAAVGRIDWNATAAPNAQGEVPFLDFGKTVNVSTSFYSDYVLVNRVLPTAGSGPIRLDGAVNSTVAGGAAGGTVWFYSPGGVIAGARSTFNVGSLLLSASDLTPEGGYGTFDRSRITGQVATDPRARVIVEQGASITANNPGSYVALLAPRVEQRGTVRVNGSAAYVAASQATLTFTPGTGLFNIAIGTGSDVNPGGEATLVHSGSTTGPASTGAAGDGQAIYMVAVPKNDAISMLVTGTVGYDAAASAGIENGVVVLSAGTNVSSTRSGGTTSIIRSLPTLATGEVQQAATLRIGNGTITSRLDGFGTAAAIASGDAVNGGAAARTLTLTRDASLSSYGWTFAGTSAPGTLPLGSLGQGFTASGATGDPAANLTLTVSPVPTGFDAGTRGRLLDAISRPVGGVQTPYVPFGTAQFVATGAATISGNLNVIATNVRAYAGAGDLPSAQVRVAGGNLAVGGNVALNADTQTSGTTARAGFAQVSIGANPDLAAASQVGGTMTVGGSLTANARVLAQSGNAQDATGGAIDLTVANSGLRVGSAIGLDASATGSAGPAARGSGTGGTITIAVTPTAAALPDPARGVVAGITAASIDADASGFGASGPTSTSGAAGTRGDGIGGSVSATFGYGRVSAGSLALTANGIGSAGTDTTLNTGQSGGNATGGTVDVLVNGATLDVGTVTLSAYAQGGDASNGEFGYGAGGELGYGSGGSGGAATGGFATFEVRSGSVASANGTSLSIAAYGRGGSGGAAPGSAAQSFGNGGAGGSAVGGRARILISGGSLTTGSSDLDAGVQGGVGGTATIGVGGAGGSAGLATPDAGRYAAVDITGGSFAAPSQLRIRSSAVGGTGGDGGAGGGAGGAAFGGAARLAVANSSLTANALGIETTTSGGRGGAATNVAGAAGSAGGRGGDATGGVARVESGSGGSITINSTFANFTTTTAGEGGQGANGTTGGAGGAGGNAIGSTIQLIANGGSISLVENGYGAALSADAAGGGGGLGGLRTSSIAAGGVGGAGGSARGGLIEIRATGGSISAERVTASAAGNGGAGGNGGFGNGEGAVQAAQGVGGLGTGGQVVFAAVDAGAAQAALTATAVSVTASGASGSGSSAPLAIAGGVSFDSSGARIGGTTQFDSLNIDTQGSTTDANSGTRITVGSGTLAISGDVQIFGNTRTSVTGTGAGELVVGQRIGIFTDAVAIDQQAPAATGSYSTIRAADVDISTGSFAGTPTSVIRATNAIDIYSRGTLDAGSLYASTLVRARSAGSLSVINASADAAIPSGTTTLAETGYGTPGGNVILTAGFSPSVSRVAGPVIDLLDPSDASVTGTVFATNTVSIAAGGDVTIAGTANVSSNNLVAIEAGDDLIVRPGAVIRAALDPIADPVTTGLRDLDGEAGLVLTAGEVGISYSRDPANPASVVLNGTFSAGARPIFIQGQALDATGATLSGRSLIVDIADAPTPAAQAAGASTDGGLLSAGCVRGNACLGAVTVTNRFEVGDRSSGVPARVPTQVRLSGGFSARVADIISQGAITLGTTTATAFTGTDVVRVQSQTGGITLIGAATVTGGGTAGAGTTSLIAAGPIDGVGATVQSSGAIGLRVGSGALTLASLVAGTTLNTLDAAGAVGTTGTLTAAGAITVSTRLAVGTGDARVTAGGPITLGQFDVLNGDANLLANSGAIDVRGTTQARDVAVRAVAGSVTMAAVNARDDIVVRADGGTATLGALRTGQTVNGAGAIDANGAADTLAARTITGNGIDLGGTGGVSVTGPAVATGAIAIAATGGAITLAATQAGGTIAITNGDGSAAAPVAGRGISATSLQAGSGVSVVGNGTADIGTLATTTGDARVDTVGAIQIASATVAAGTATFDSSAGGVAIGTLQASGTSSLLGSLDVSVTSATSGPITARGRSVTVTAPGGLTVASAIATGGNVALTANGGPLSVTGVQATGGIALANGTATAGTTPDAARSIAASALQAGTTLSVIGDGAISLGTVQAGGATSLAGLLDVSVTSLASGPVTASGRSITLTAPGALIVSAATATDGLTLDATGDLRVIGASARGSRFTSRTGGIAVDTVNDPTTIGLQAALDIAVGAIVGAPTTAVTARGRSIALTAANGLDIVDATTTGGAIRITANSTLPTAPGQLLVRNASATGAIDLIANNGALVATGTASGTRITATGDAIRGGQYLGTAAVSLVAQADVDVDRVAGATVDVRSGTGMAVDAASATQSAQFDAGGAITLGSVTAGTSIDARSGGLLTLTGDFTAPALRFASAEIEIGSAANVGGPGTTSLSLANAGPYGTLIGGDDADDGIWSLSNDEFARLSAQTIDIARVETGYGSAALPFTVRRLDIFGPDSTPPEGRRVNLTASELILTSPGSILVDGPVSLVGARSGDRIVLRAGERIDVVTPGTPSATAPGGSIGIVDAQGGLTGTIAFAAREVRVGSAQAISDLDTIATTDEKTVRLGTNDGPVRDAGYVQANRIEATVANGVFIQNSGINDRAGSRAIDPDARRGFTVGSGGFAVTASGSAAPAVVVNGRRINPDGSLTTGPALIPFVSYDGGEGRVAIDAASTVNGCLISDLSCGIARGAFQGTPTLASGNATIDRQDQFDTITIIGDRATIDWAPYDSDGTGPIDFLPVANVGLFRNEPGAGNFVVLNRVLPTTNRPIVFNGTVAGRLRASGGGADTVGGTIWFYSPGGIVAGPTSIFDVGSLLLTANPLTLNSDGGMPSFTNLDFGAAGGAIRITAGAQLLGADPSGYVALVGGSIDQAGSVTADGSAILASGSGVNIDQTGTGYAVSAASQPSPAVAVATSGQTEARNDVILAAGNGRIAAGALTAGRDVLLGAQSGASVGIVNAGNDIVAGTGAAALDTASLTARRNVTLLGSGAFTIGAVDAGGSLLIATPASLVLTSARAGVDITLSTRGAQQSGTLAAGRDVLLVGQAGGRAAAISAGRDIVTIFAGAPFTASSMTATGNVALDGAVAYAIGPVIAGGSVRGAGLASAEIEAVRAGQDVSLAAFGNLALGGVTAGRDIALATTVSSALPNSSGGVTVTSATAGGNLSIRGVGLVTAGDVRTTGAGLLSLASASGVRANTVDGFQDVAVTVQPAQGAAGNGGIQIGTTAAGRDLTLTSGAGAVQLGNATAVRALSARVTGSGQIAGFSAAALSAGAGVDVSAAGAVTVGDVTAATTATLASGTDLGVRGVVSAPQAITLAANRIFVTSQRAVADIAGLDDTDAISARLGVNDRGLVPEGYLRADRISFNVGSAVYVQNSGGAAFEERAGFTAGPGGVRVVNTGQGPARVVINGRQRLADGGFVTGLAFIPLVGVEGSGGFDPRSTVNGCIIGNPASCVVAPPQDFFPVQDVVLNALGGTDLGFLLPPLIQFVDFDPRPGAPLIDEPVTGSANEDLWTPPENGDPECGPGSPGGTPCPAGPTQ